jgi:tetratricopeptide (TPR) repeat protein
MHFALHSISLTMRQSGWTLPRFLLCASLLILCAFFSACHHHPQKYPQNNSDTKTQPALVEQQLLNTIQHAETLGPGNPLLLSSLYSLADFYHDRKEYEKSADQYQRALNIKESINGPDHPDLAVILQRYARVLQEAKRPTEAANLLARANAILAQSDVGPRSQ